MAIVWQEFIFSQIIRSQKSAPEKNFVAHGTAGTCKKHLNIKKVILVGWKSGLDF